MKKLLAALSLVIAISFALPIIPSAAFPSLSITASAATAKKPSMPTLSHESGTYSTAFTLTATAANGEKIRYTMDGTKPTSKSKLYKSGIKINKNTTVRIAAFKNGKMSKIVKRTFYIRADSPQFSAESGTYEPPLKVIITSADANAQIYYTTDGTTPTKKSSKYYSPVGLSDYTVLKAIAYVDGHASSKISTRTYKFSTERSYKEKYGYSQLDANERKAYQRIYESILSFKTEINLSDLYVLETSISKIFHSVRNDNAEIPLTEGGFSYWSSDNVVTSIEDITYFSSSEKYPTELAAIEKAAKEIIAKIPKGAGHYETVKAVHDQIILQTQYSTTNGQVRTPYGSLVGGYSLCEGYLRTFQYVMQKLGYDVILVCGSVENDGHMWNMIKLDGDWYHIDVTFDDPTGIGSDNIDYNYFLITDEQILKDHSIDIFDPTGEISASNIYPIPKATATKYNVLVHEGITIHSDKASPLRRFKAK